jgi:3-hydroxyacyl-CoA dehydrogenase
MTTPTQNHRRASDVVSVTVLGTGVIGAQIAYQTAYSGFDVTAYDISDEILEGAKQRFAGLAARYEREVDGAAGGGAQAALARIAYSSDLGVAVRDADLAIEAVPEVLDLKRDVYVKLGKLAPAKTIFATNSSTLLPSAIAEFTGRPDRFLAMHFANQIWVHNTAEVMGHPGTDPSAYQTVVEFARRIGMVPIELKKEQPGYIGNSLLWPFLSASLELLVDGVADHETIDTTWRIFSGAPAGPFSGPFRALDVIGMDTAHNILTGFGDERSLAFARYLKKHYIDRGKLGVATGEGFYTYPAKTQQESSERRARSETAVGRS